MNNSNRLIDLYSQKLSLSTNQAVADRLNIQRPTVSMWRSGKSHPDAVSIEKMCTAIGEPLRQWLPLIEAERAHSPAAKRVWLRLAQAAAAVVMTLSFGLLNVQTAHAEGLQSAAHNQGTLYIMSTLRKWCEAAGTLFAGLLRAHRSCNVEVLMEV
jgi:transcriptional regulator with XRE-family HTH domain